MRLNELRDNPNARKSRTRVGRGIGSGKGKTAGRGHKGQKSRSGVAIKSFEGGQMPLYRRLPKRGFKSLNKKNLAIFNLSKIETINKNKLDLSKNKINLDFLHKVKLVNKRYSKLKILGTGELKLKLEIETNFISKSAKDKVEKAGGKVSLIK